ncbi:MAG: hypothetical protein R3B47_16895 [Bacteroidia bacterium]
MILKIGPLTNLQDARYSAAVGMNLVSFSLARGDHRKLSAATVWNIAQWLEGPELVLEMNIASLEELDGLGVDPRYLVLPFEEFEPALFNYCPAIMLKTGQEVSPETIQAMVNEAEQSGFELKFEISLDETADPESWEAVAGHVLFHFPGLEKADAFIAKPSVNVFGLAFGEEAEEEPQVLHYEMLDDIAARFTDVHL